MVNSSDQPQFGTQSKPVCNFFRKLSKNKNLRKPTIDETNDEHLKSDSSIIPNNKKKPPIHQHFSTGPPSRMNSDSDPMFQFESSKQIQVQNDSKATATLETIFSRDSRAIRERVLGASAHIRVSARFDYQLDICKDYKENGYCGYGDACKFMHDRGDYKPGWQLEKEWDEAEKLRKKNLAMGIDDDDALAFACFICRKPFVDAVVTKRRHYFCEHCALKHHSKHKKCFVCNKPTLGIFNSAHEIRKRKATEEKMEYDYCRFNTSVRT